MNIDNPSQDDIVEAATALGGALLIIGAGISVYTGTLEVPLAWEIIVVALGILGFHEAGRRRGKKSALIKWGLEQLDDAGERQGAQNTSPSAAGESVPNSVDSDAAPSDSSQTGTPASHSTSEQMKAAGYTPSNPDADDSATGLRTITGIGPTYADLLTGQRVESVADLATANTAALAASTGITQPRLDKWQQQANELTADETSGNDLRGLGGP